LDAEVEIAGWTIFAANLVWKIAIGYKLDEKTKREQGWIISISFARKHTIYYGQVDEVSKDFGAVFFKTP
jgi:hypothetical protein